MSCCQNCGGKGKLYREDIQHGLVFCGLECQQELIGSGEILDFVDQYGPQLTWQLFLRRGSGVEGRRASTEKVVGYIAREFFNNRNEKIKTLLRWIVNHPEYIPQMQIDVYDKKNSFLYVFLYYAIEEDSVDMVKFIFEELGFSIYSNKSELYDLVLQKINVLQWLIDAEKFYPNFFHLKIAVLSGLDKSVALLSQYVDPSIENNYAIRFASAGNHINVVKVLLQDKRVDPSAINNYAIREASENGHVEVVKLLLQDNRVDPSAEDNEAINSAMGENHIEVVKLLLKDPRVQSSLSSQVYYFIKEKYPDDEEIQEILKLISITKSRGKKQEEAEPIIRRRRQLNNFLK